MNLIIGISKPPTRSQYYARKLQEADGGYYDLEFEFECDLYHFPQDGKTGLWSPLKKGIFVGKIKGASR